MRMKDIMTPGVPALKPGDSLRRAVELFFPPYSSGGKAGRARNSLPRPSMPPAPGETVLLSRSIVQPFPNICWNPSFSVMLPVLSPVPVKGVSRAGLSWLTGAQKAGGTYRRRLGEAEREVIISALNSTGGNKTRAAQLLGISRSDQIA